MAKDLRQILAGCLTASMLLMLCNMVKKDHIDPLLDDISVQSISSPGNNISVQYSRGNNISVEYSRGNDKTNNSKRSLVSSEVVNPCWKKSTYSKSRESRGFIFVTLTQDPEYHFSQISNAVVVAKYLGATLVFPHIKGTEPGQERKFGEIYDVKKFAASLDGKVRVIMDPQSAEISNERVITVRVPNMVSKQFIMSNIEPIFIKSKSLRISTYFPSTIEHNQNKKMHMNVYACLATFETLRLRPDLYESIESMILTLRSISPRSQGRFIAIDYSSQCHDNNATGIKHCFDVKEIALTLKKIGWGRETPIYLTLNGWYPSVEYLRNIFPNTFTKDAIIPANQKPKLLNPKSAELKQIIDLYISSAADVFVPTSSNLFSDNVVARRISTGKTQVIMPAANKSSSSANDYTPSYISKRKHWAYSCFC